MAVSIEDIIKKEFSRSLMGYDMQEVDVFLDSIIDRMEKMELERTELMAAMEKLLKRVERLEKATDGEAAIESGAKAARKITSAASPVRVQSAKRPAIAEKTDEKPAKKPVADVVNTDAPAFSKPIRPAAQPLPKTATLAQAPAAPMPTVPAPDAASPITSAPLQSTPEAAAQAAPFAQLPQSFTDVAIEMESGIYAASDSEIIPDLLEGIESALLEGRILPASRKDTPVRGTDKSRVS